MISGGHDNNLGALTTNNYLITLPWASSQAASCTPPGDLANPDKGHIIGHSGQSIVKCGGALDGKNCEKYNPVSGSWDHVAWMAKDRRYFDSVQLDNERLWIGRNILFPMNSSLSK